MDLLVDDGNADRGHRKNVFSDVFKLTGVGCKDHKDYGSCTVIDFVGGFVKKAGGQSSRGQSPPVKN